MNESKSLSNQIKLNESINGIPIEIFEWGRFPDHYKIDPPHTHEFAELIFFTEGGGNHQMNYKNHLIKKNSIHYIPPSIVHYMERTKQSQGFTIAFEPSYIENNKTHRLVNPFSLNTQVLNLRESEFQKIEKIIKIIDEEIKCNIKYYREKKFLLAFELLLNSICSHLNLETPVQSMDFDIAREFKFLVKTNLRKKINVDQLASKLNVTPGHLCFMIKRELGTSPKKYIQKALLDSIINTLLSSSQTIKSVAYNYGMTPAILARFFKNQMGCSITDYVSYRKSKYVNT